MIFLKVCYPRDLKIILTNDNKIGSYDAAAYAKPRANTKAAKNIKISLDSNTTNTIYLFSNLGQVYKMLGNDIPNGEVSCNDIVKLDDGEKIVNIVNYNNEQYLITLTTDGYGKKTNISEFDTNRKKAGVAGMKLNDGAEMINGLLCNDNDNIVFMSSDGKGFMTSTNDLSPQGRATKGRKTIRLKEGSYLAYGAIVKDGASEVVLDKKHAVNSIKVGCLGLMGNKI